MGQCVNSKHPEVVIIAGELNTHPAVVAAQIGIWQEKNNNYNRFPTAEEVNKSKIESDVSAKSQRDSKFKEILNDLYSKGATLEDYIEHRNISHFELGSKEDLEHFESKYDNFSNFDNTKIDFFTEEEYKDFSKLGSLLDFVLFKQSPLYNDSRVKKGIKEKLKYFKAFLDHQKNNVEETLDRLSEQMGNFTTQSVINEKTSPLFNENPSTTLSISEGNSLLFGDTEIDVLNVNEVLNNIINNDSFKSDEKSSEIVKKLALITANSKTKIKTASTNAENSLFNKDTVMVYDRINDIIYTTQRNLDSYNQNTLISALLHEMVHAVTVNRMLDPQSFEDKQFNDLVDKAYEQFKHLALESNSEGQLSYGFKDKFEFVAEVYSNPQFRNEIKKLDETWLSKFFNSIRRILGLTKTKINEEFISSTVLFNTIDNSVENSSYKQSSIVGQRYFNKQEHSAGSLDEKLQNLIELQLNNINQILKRAQASNRFNNNKNVKFIEDTEKLYKNLEIALDADYIKGISNYVDFMINQIHLSNSSIDNKNENEINLDYLKRLDGYVAASNLTDEIVDRLTDARIKGLSPEIKNEVTNILDKLGNISGSQNILLSKIKNLKKDLIKKELKKPFFVNQSILKYKESISSEYPKNSKLSKKDWLNEQVALNPQKVEEFVNVEINDILETSTQDIHFLDKSVYSSIKTESKLIQLVQKIISKMKVEIDGVTSGYDFHLKSIYDKYTNKGVYNTKKMLTEDSKGVQLLKGEYPVEIYNHFTYTVRELRAKRSAKWKELESQGYSRYSIINNSEYSELRSQLDIAKTKYTILNSENVRIIDPKYKTNLNLTEGEQLLYDEFKKIAKEGEDVFGKHSSLMTDYHGALFIRLPYKTITNLERTLDGKLNPVDYLKQKKSEIFNWKIDEIDQYQAMFDAKGNKIFNIPIMFRNNTKQGTPEFERSVKEQSLDLFTLLRMERFNVTNFKVKSENEMVLNILTDVAGNKDYIKSEGLGDAVKNIFGKHVSQVSTSGSDSKTYKRLQEITQQSLYNVFRENGFKVLGADSNKIIQTLNRHTSFLGMTLNFFNAPVNVANGEFQMLLARLTGDLDANTLRSAHAEYLADMPNLMADLGRPVKESKINQLNLLLDMFGGLSQSQNDFIVNSIFKNVADPQTLQFLQEGGEHMLHSVLAIALAKSIKVYNKNGKIIDKNGVEILDSKNSASLYDMLKFENKQLTFDTSKFAYTEVSMNMDFETEGLASVRLFIKNHIENMFGQYDINFANSLQRTGFGQLLIMYKKYLVPMGLHRFRGGLQSAFGKLDKEMHYNSSAQSYEEGFYISSIKVLRKLTASQNKGLAGMLELLKYEILSKNWNDLTDLERKNTKKFLIEMGTLVILTNVIVPLIIGLAKGMDDDKIWYLAMLARRLEQELSQFVDISDAYNLTKNPVASLNLVETWIDTLKFGLTPWTWTSETSKGDLRVLNTLEKLTIPSALRKDRTAKSILQMSVQNSYVPYTEGIFYETFAEE